MIAEAGGLARQQNNSVPLRPQDLSYRLPELWHSWPSAVGSNPLPVRGPYIAHERIFITVGLADKPADPEKIKTRPAIL